MTTEERDALLAKPLDAILAVQRPSAPPQLTPLWFFWDGEAFYLSTTRDRAKYPNVKRNPVVSLIVNDQAAHTYVVAYGRAEIVEENKDEVMALTLPIIAKYAPPDNAERMAASLMQQDRVVIVLRPQRIVTR